MVVTNEEGRMYTSRSWLSAVSKDVSTYRILTNMKMNLSMNLLVCGLLHSPSNWSLAGCYIIYYQYSVVVITIVYYIPIHQMRSECAQYQQIVREEDTTSHHRSRRSRFSQPINTGSDSDEQSGTAFNPNTDLSDFSVAKAFVYEVDCIEAFEKLLTTIPQEMCYLGKSLPITHALNTQCWTGYSLGE